MDDTQLQKSVPLSEVINLTKELSACTDDIKARMTENQLKLNDDKTEALLFPFSSSIRLIRDGEKGGEEVWRWG